MKRSDLLISVAGVLAALCITSSALRAGDISYSVTDLGNIGLPGCVGLSINSSGQVVGDGNDSLNYGQAFLYTGSGPLIDLGCLSGGAANSSVATCINDNGLIVGYSGIANPADGHAFAYSRGTMQDLGTLGGTSSFAQGVNDAGQIVGNSLTASGAYDGFLYSNGQMRDLSAFQAYAINNSGQIAGRFSNGDAAIENPNGSFQDLGNIGGDGGNAWAINNRGQAAGDASTAGDGADHAFFYNGMTMLDLGTFGGLLSSAEGINDWGQVVGQADTAAGSTHAFLYANGTMEDLNNLIDPSSGWILESAYGINDNGLICGVGINPYGQSDAFLLTPVPEPSALLLLTTALVAVLGLLGLRRLLKGRPANIGAGVIRLYSRWIKPARTVLETRRLSLEYLESRSLLSNTLYWNPPTGSHTWDNNQTKNWNTSPNADARGVRVSDSPYSFPSRSDD